jgi:spore germination protein KC
MKQWHGKSKLILLIMALCLWFSGCWDRKELKTQGVIAGMGVDRTFDGKYQYTFQVIKPGEVGEPKKAGGGGQPVWVGTSSGNTPYEAGRNIAFQSSRRMFFSHNQVMIIGKEAAKRGIRPILDLEFRFYQIHTLTPLLIADTTAREVLEVPGGMEKIPAVEIAGELRGAKYTSEVILVTFQDFFGYLISKTRAPVAPQVEVIDEGNGKRFLISGTAVFKQDRWIGTLNREETRGMLWVTGQVERGILNIPSRPQMAEAAVEIIGAGVKIHPEIRHNKKLLFQIQINAEGNLQDFIAQQGLTNPSKVNNKIHELEKLGAGVIRHEILASWHQARQLKADIYGFGEAVHRKYPKQWKEMEPVWESIFPEISLKIKVEVSLKRIGENIQPPIPILEEPERK